MPAEVFKVDAQIIGRVEESEQKELNLINKRNKIVFALD